MTATKIVSMFGAMFLTAALSAGCGDKAGSPEAEANDPTNPSNIASQQSGAGDSSGDSSGGDSSAP